MGIHEKISDLYVSVVIPVYNSEDCLDELAARLTEVLNDLGKTYEIVMVNDYSSDSSWGEITELCGKYGILKGINLRRNFGQDSAIMAGLNHSSGEFVIIMDDDLQHDPVDIPFLLAELVKGYDVCYARFTTKKQSWFKNFGSWFNDKVANLILKKPKEIYLSPYKAIRRGVADEIIKYDGPYPYVDGLIFRVTRNITQITATHYERYAGKGNYNLRKSMRIWLRLATNFSIIPLRIATTLGFASSGTGFILALILIIQHFLDGEAPVGWASTVVVILLLGGIQLVSMGIIGEYMGRVFLHQSKEPQFVIKEVLEKSGSEQ